MSRPYWRKEPRETWWGLLIWLVFCTSAVALLGALFGMPLKSSFVLSYGIMGTLSGIAFLAESAVMGLTAKAGGFFWFIPISVGVCHWIGL